MGLSKLWQEFKAFAFKGNMIDLAVAVVIGAAFSGVINSLVKDIIMPSITYVTTSAKTAVSTAADVAHNAASAVGVTSKPSETQPTTEPSAPTPAPAAAAAPPAPAPPAAPAEPKPVDISWTIGRIRIGNFLGELLNFFLIAFAVFMVIVKMLGSVMKRVGGTPAPSEPTTKECPFCLSVIPMKARKCAHCTADLPAS
ncbi:MAG TPA: large-conductance mechanosensitive channel protein MscL, partial [Humisphaera sp.]|nr:large-conductance mechanosensitive channel protein MscL [Humisphaera sp.]